MNIRPAIPAVVLLVAASGSGIVSAHALANPDELAGTTMQLQETSSVNASAALCRVTPFTTASPPASVASFPGTWYTNSAKTLWAGLASPFLGIWYAGLDEKVLWSRHGQLTVTARRSGGAARPVRVNIPSGYEGEDYQASGITFPSTGCWRVMVRSGAASLSFVVRVYPYNYRPSTGDASTLRLQPRLNSARITSRWPS